MSSELLTYSETTNEITITACPVYLEAESNPDAKAFAFAYTITIENGGTETVQLISRHWYVYSGGTLYTEVQGEGVIGEQPVLEPGEGFQYTSGSVIRDPIGSMHGTYLFRSEGGKEFEVQIPKFDLFCPDYLN